MSESLTKSGQKDATKTNYKKERNCRATLRLKF
jgi:hypothetical protein